MEEDRMLSDEILLGLIKANSGGGGGGGTDDYNDLKNQPQIGGVTLSGNKSLADLGAQEKLTAGMYININSGTISVKRDVSEDVDEILTLTQDGYNLIATLSIDGTVIESETFTQAGGTFLDLIAIDFNTRVVRWHYTYLKASKNHAVGYSEYIYSSPYTDTFVVTIGEENKLIIKSEMDTALSGKQDTLTFDDTPTDNSNNPVKSNGIYDALALKQNATDNSLETEAKTIVGAINENAGDISSLKSGLTDLTDHVNGDATTYPYADVITINDAVPANLADCSVKVEPVQDLHGYDKPWVGGAGKNIIPMTVAGIKTANTTGTWSGDSYTNNGITWTILTDSNENVIGIKANGTTSDSISLFVLNNNFIVPESVAAYINGSTANVINKVWLSDWSGGAQSIAGEDKAITTPSDGILRCRLQVDVNKTVSNEIAYPMIRLATETDSTFAPYTNICPISGHTEAVVTRCGNNLIENNTFSGVGIYIQSTVFPVIGDYVHRNVTFSGSGAFTFKLFGIKNGVETVIDEAGYGVSFDDIRNNVSQYDYIRVIGYSNDASNRLSNIMVAFTDTDTALPYEPFKGKTYTLALGDTIYGGTVDFETGVMTVDRAYYEFNGSETWTKRSGANSYQHIENLNIIDAWNVSPVTAISNLCRQNGNGAYYGAEFSFGYTTSNNILYVGAPSIESVEDFKTYLSNNHLQIVGTLATPFTVQLTPTQIQLLQGTNTLHASTGDISVTVNGVSGAIGAVQEQVNGLAEDVAEKQDKNVYMSDWGRTFTVKCAINTLIMLGGSGTRSYLYIYNNYINLVTPITDSSETVTSVKNEDGTTTFTWEHDMHMSVIPLDAVIA